MNTLDIQSLKSWFLNTKRDLPWRCSPTPYQVWVSEVMLQQTQVAVVIPYYERWMERFPTVEALAASPLEDVVKVWEGLGYYSRARNLHTGAQQVMREFGGALPNNAEELSRIKGLGPYTVGAILSFAFHQKAPAVDGNVIRVLARFYGIEDDISKGRTQRQLRELTEELLPDVEPWVISEALIELGATVCQKKPSCGPCPLNQSCSALHSKRTDVIPFKAAKIKYEKLHRAVAVIHCDGHYLIRQCLSGEVMAGLHEFPYFEAQEAMDEAAVQDWIHSDLDLEVQGRKALKPVQHSFTRFRVKLYPYLFTARSRPPIDNYEWRSIRDLHRLAFSSGHRRVLQNLDHPTS